MTKVTSKFLSKYGKTIDDSATRKPAKSGKVVRGEHSKHFYANHPKPTPTKVVVETVTITEAVAEVVAEQVVV